MNTSTGRRGREKFVLVAFPFCRPTFSGAVIERTQRREESAK
jgi:hypothetical protein